MINKSRLLVVATITLLAACVSDDDLTQVQSQVSRLQGKVSHLEGQLAQSKEELALTKGELAVVKEQRVVRLPTGAPLEMRARNESVSNRSSSTSTASASDTAYSQAVQQYKSGNTQGAIVAFEHFLASYPNAQYRNEALFYLGQAAYTSRDYYRAQQALETLVFQPTNGQVNQSAARLLQNVYQAQGNTGDAEKLEAYLRSYNQQQTPVMPRSAETPAAPTTLTPPVVETPKSSAVVPTAADEVQKQVETIIEKTDPKPVRPVFVTQ